MTIVKLTHLFLVASLLAACDLRPDLKRLYETQGVNAEQPPVIIIPGLFGSKLRDRETKKEFWLGSVPDILFGDYAGLKLEIDPATLGPMPSPLEAHAITEGALWQDFYGEIIKTLRDHGGYLQGVPGEPIGERRPRYYLFPYDWRQDNVVTTRALDALIEQIRRDYRDPGLKVDIIAHSMGGLIARYYLRYGTTDVLDSNEFPVNLHGASRIRKLILLGTPNLGSVGSLHSFILGHEVVFNRIPTEVLATMPSAYQLFPHPIHEWLISAKGEALDRDLFDREIWERFQWSVFDPDVVARVKKTFHDPQQGVRYVALLQDYFGKHLERARRFVWSLTLKLEQAPIRYIVLGGDCELTPARLLVEEEKGDSVVRLYPNEIKRRLPEVPYDRLMLEPGDGRVTKPSLLARESLDPTVPRHKYSFFPLDFAFFLCVSHDRLTGNINFQNNLLNVLLTRGAESEE
jgi:pimeloyl-ACP methyl ester carboxylesterase